MQYRQLAIILLLIISLSLNAEVSLDGTLGQRGTLPGPDYLIGADLGQQHGGNLFHSFQDFNLQSFESATFSGPNSVSNVISRVTGGNPSNIDGLLRSTLPNADMYFLNPYGIMFGPNAKLDVPGSFHASTADTLRLQDGGQFNARQPGNSVLTVAPVEAFGFLTSTPAAITIENSDLSVPAGRTFSLIGGDLHLKGDSPVIFDGLGFAARFAGTKMAAASGRINLASVASIGEIIPREFELDLTGDGGTITANNTLVEVSGRGSGEIFIRGGQFVMRDSTIQANTLADLDGKMIDLKLTESVNINGELLAILSKTFGSGDAGDILMTTPQLEITGGIINGASLGKGRSGNIKVEARQVLLKDGGALYSTIARNGQGGNINITATERLSLSGRHASHIISDSIVLQRYPSIISTAILGPNKTGDIVITTGHLDMVDGIVAADTFSSGKAGNITVNANTANLTAGASITSNTFANGEGGNVNLTITDTLVITGQRVGRIVSPLGMVVDNAQSYVGSMAFGKGHAGNIFISAATLNLNQAGGITTITVGEGDAGNVTIEVNDLQVTKGSGIGSNNNVKVGEQMRVGSGKSGNLHITAKGNILISGKGKTGDPSSLGSVTASPSSGGDIFMSADKLTIADGGNVSASSVNTGNAGKLTLQANTITINDGGEISTAAIHASGGNITVNAHDVLYLRDGKITTSVGAGKGQGGDITIENPVFVILDNGRIVAQADEGSGGDIRISSNQFLASPDSLVSASSRLGIDGEVEIEAPEVSLDEFLVVLPGGFVDVSLKHCDIQEIDNPSSFRVTQEQRVPPFVRVK